MKKQNIRIVILSLSLLLFAITSIYREKVINMDLSLQPYLDGDYKFSQINKQIKVAIVNKQYLINEKVIHIKLAENLYVVPVVETKENVVVYNKHAKDNRSDEKIIEEGIKRTFDNVIEYEGISKFIDDFEFQFFQMTGESYFLTSLILNPDFIEQVSGDYGMLFTMTSRNEYVVAPVKSLKNIEAIISILGMYTYDLYCETESKKIIPDLFYYKDGSYINIAIYDDEENFELSIPEDLLGKSNNKAVVNTN